MSLFPGSAFMVGLHLSGLVKKSGKLLQEFVPRISGVIFCLIIFVPTWKRIFGFQSNFSPPSPRDWKMRLHGGAEGWFGKYIPHTSKDLLRR